MSTVKRTTDLNETTRERAWERLADDRYDVIVIGGGVTGTGVALDAASRGLRTALIERVDLAAGTSRWSSKLIHGGLRYLAKADIGVAWESAVERDILMQKTAPHLCKPRASIIPIDKTGVPLGLMMGAGVHIGNALRIGTGTPGELLPTPSWVNKQSALVHAPGLRQEGLRGGVVYWDGQVEDDARLVTALARTAAGFGVDVVLGCDASDLQERSVTLTDRDTGNSIVAEGLVVNATGVWAGEYTNGVTMTPSRGSHLVVSAERMGNPRAVLTAAVPDKFGRFVFAVPHPDGLCYIGLTDEPDHDADGIAPTVPEDDVTFLLDTINQILDDPLTVDDVLGRFAGLRPLVTMEGATSTADVSRKHLLVDRPGEPFTITGGKLTTYRHMAEETVDAVCARRNESRPCVTTSIPLIGFAKPSTLAALDAPARLIRRYGIEAPRLVELIDDDPSLGEPVAGGCPVLAAEFAFGVIAEGARTPQDLVERRTRVSLVDSWKDSATVVAEAVLDRYL